MLIWFDAAYSIAPLTMKLQLKTAYKVFQAVKENSGFGWDIEKQIPTAPDEVWETYIAVRAARLYCHIGPYSLIATFATTEPQECRKVPTRDTPVV